MRTSAGRADVMSGRRNPEQQWQKRSVSNECRELTMTAPRQSARIVSTKKMRKVGREREMSGVKGVGDVRWRPQE